MAPEAGRGCVVTQETMTRIGTAEHARLCAVEAAAISLRRKVADAAIHGLEERRTGIERQIGALIVALTEMEEAGDISRSNALAAAQMIAAQRRGELGNGR